MNDNELPSLFRRICERLGIAFSENRVVPSLGSMQPDDLQPTLGQELDAAGKQFGFRFREITGTMKQLFQALNASGPALVSTDSGLILVLELASRGRVMIHADGEDQTVSRKWLREKLLTANSQETTWFLVRPLYAAEDVSRLHYSNAQNLTPLRRFTKLLRRDGQDIRTIVIFSVVIGLLSLTTPLAVEAVVNTIAFGRYLQPLVILSLIVLTFLGFRAGLNVLMTVVMEILQRKLFVRTVEDLSYRLVRVPLSVWQKYHGPELVNRFFDIANVQKITSKLFLETLMLFLQTVIGLTVLAFYHPFLLGYDIGLLAMMTIVLWFIGRGAIRTAKEESQLKFETGAWLQEIVRHPSSFKFNGGLGFAINRADELTARYIKQRQAHFKIVIRQISFAMVMQVLAATTLLAIGGYLVIAGQMTLGQLVAAELIVTVILGSFAKFGKDLESYYDLMASVDKLGKLFDLPVEQSDKLELARQPGAYTLALVDVNLSPNSGVETVQFAAGKSHALSGGTEIDRKKIIDTMIGQVKPDQGFVLLNDFRVDSISSESLQEKVSIVRDIEIFEGTVDENLRLGRRQVGPQDVNTIINLFGLRDTISSLEKGLKTTLRISGYPLSRSQAIRLILARALVTRPGILFIDGMLDWLADDEIDDVLNRLQGFLNETTIVIATGRKQISEWTDQQVNLSGN